MPNSSAILPLYFTLVFISCCHCMESSSSKSFDHGGVTVKSERVSNTTRIFGGWNVPRKLNTNFFASVRILGQYFACGATVISRRHVVTAAHCFIYEESSIRLSASSFSVNVGTKYSNSKTGYPYKVSNILINSEYLASSKKRNAPDIAVIVLEKPISMKIYKRLKIRAPPKLYSKVQFFGMGMETHVGSDTTYPPPSQAPYLKTVLFQTTGGRRCNYEQQQMKTRICTAPMGSKHTSMCRLDSGSPLVSRNGNSFSFIGIASRITGKCNKDGTLGVFTKVISFKPYLSYKEIAKGISGQSARWTLYN